MKMLSEHEVFAKRNAQNNFLKQFSGVASTVDRIPDSLSVLVSEMSSLGESMMRKIIKRYSIGTDGSNDMIEFDNLVDLISLFKFNCHFADIQELKFYLFNQGIIEESMKQHTLRKDKIYIDCEVLFRKLKECYGKLGFSQT